MAPEDERALVAEPPAEPAADAPGEAAQAAQPNNSKAAWIVAAIATAVALIAAMFAVSGLMRDKNNNPTGLNAGGFNAAGFNRPISGTVQSIKGSSFTVKETGFNGQTSSTEVSTNNKTTFTEMVSGTLGNFKVGDSISATGTTADNVFTATQISETTGQRNFTRNANGAPNFGNGNGGPPQGNFGNGAPPQGNFPGNGGGGGGRFFGGGNGGDVRIGQITKIDGGTITLSSFDGSTQTINTTSSTTYRVSKTTTLKSLKVGDTVRVTGATSGNKVTATEVTKGVNDGGQAA